MHFQQVEMKLFEPVEPAIVDTLYRNTFLLLLTNDLDFHGENSTYASHDFHAFPAKFPPQLPKKFIEHLTKPGDSVLDPMMGSGTTVLEAFLTGRQGVGFDIDPLALRLCKVKVTPLEIHQVAEIGNSVLEQAQARLKKDTDQLRQIIGSRFDEASRKFIDYWFAAETQLELIALISEIELVNDDNIRGFLELVFSAIIITKSGGVSLARDLAHTRPHKVEDKKVRSAFAEYEKRLKKNLKSLAHLATGNSKVDFYCANAQSLTLPDNIVDLIVTSPPYASNAINYMRAHKFSLVWLGYSIDELSRLRKEYIGGEATNNLQFKRLPDFSEQIILKIAEQDQKKAGVLRRYYSEMMASLTEMHRVLKPGRAAVIVVGSSRMRGIDTQTQICLGEIGQHVGFELVHIATRKLDRDKRMMPARREGINSQIEERMHEEYIIGFLKPTA